MTFAKGKYYGGGFPRGVRRHPESADAKRLVLKARRDGWSWRDIAAMLKVHDRAVRKYASGQSFPSPAVMRRLRRYFA